MGFDNNKDGSYEPFLDGGDEGERQVPQESREIEAKSASYWGALKQQVDSEGQGDSTRIAVQTDSSQEENKSVGVGEESTNTIKDESAEDKKTENRDADVKPTGEVGKESSNTTTVNGGAPVDDAKDSETNEPDRRANKLPAQFDRLPAAGPINPGMPPSWCDKYGNLVPPGGGDFRAGINELAQVPAGKRDVMWCNNAVDCFKGKIDPANRQAVLREMMNATRAVDKDFKPHFLNTFLRLSQVDAAERMQEASAQKNSAALREAARDLAMFSNLNSQPAKSGEVLLRAISGLSQSADGKLVIAGGGSNFVRAATEGTVPFEKSDAPGKGVPGSVEDLFKKHPGLWEAAQNDTQKMYEKTDEEYRRLVTAMLRTENPTGADSLSKQIESLESLNDQTFQRYDLTVSDLKVLAAARVLAESDDLGQVNRALETLRSSKSDLATKINEKLDLTGLNREVTSESLSEFRNSNGKALTELIRESRDQTQARFLEEPLHARLRGTEVAMDRPDMEFLEKLQKQLQVEADHGNKNVTERLEWVNAEVLCRKIGESTSPQAAREYRELLTKSIVRKDGSINQHALTAAIGLLGSNASESKWLDLKNIDKTETFFTPMSMDKESQLKFSRELVIDLQKVLDSHPDKPLSKLQVHMLCLALQNPTTDSDESVPNDKLFTQKVEEILRKSLRKDGRDEKAREERVTVAIEAMLNGATGLGPILLEAGGDRLREFAPHLESLPEECTPDAMVILAALASNTVGSDKETAKSAGEMLCRLANRNEGEFLGTAIEIATKTINERGDRGSLLETLGNLSFLTEVADFDTRMLLTQGYRNAHSETARLGPEKASDATDYTKTPVVQPKETEALQSSHRESASLALFADTRNLDSTTIDTICSNMSLEMVDVIHKSVDTMNDAQIEQFARTLRLQLERASLYPSENVDHIKCCLLAFQAFSAKATTEDANALGKLLDFEIKNDDPRAEKLKEMQKIALETTFSLLGSSSQQVRDSVITRLEKQTFSPHLFTALREDLGVVLLAAHHLTIPELKRLNSFMPGINSTPPLSLMLDGMGLSDPKATAREIIECLRKKSNAQSAAVALTGVSVLADSKMDAGKELSEKFLPVLNAAATFNRLPASTQQDLLSRAGLPTNQKINVNEVARTLVNGEKSDVVAFLEKMNKQCATSLDELFRSNKSLVNQFKNEEEILVNGMKRVEQKAVSGLMGGITIPGTPDIRVPNEKVESIPEDLSKLPVGPKSQELMLSELARLKREDEKSKQAQMEVISKATNSPFMKMSVIAGTIHQFTYKGPNVPRIKEVEDWLERNGYQGLSGAAEIYNIKSAKLTERLTENQKQIQELRAVESTSTYLQLRAVGNNEAADQLLIQLWAQDQLPEGLNKDLKTLWKRMNDLGFAPCPELPDLSGKPEEMMKKANDVLKSIKRHTNQPDPVIQRLETLLVKGIEARCESIILAQPAVLAAADEVGTLSRETKNLQMYFQIAAATEDGKRDQSLTEYLTTSAKSADAILKNGAGTKGVQELIADLEKQRNALPPESESRAVYKEAIVKLNKLIAPLNPGAQQNKALEPFLKQCIDPRTITNHEWYVRMSAELIKTGVVTLSCAATQAACELVPYAGHPLSMVLVPAVATATTHIVDERLFEFGMQDHGSYLCDAALQRPQWDAETRSFYVVPPGKAAEMLAREYAAEFEMNAAGAGLGWIGGRLGKCVGRQLGMKTVMHVEPGSYLNRFVRNAKAGVGTGIALSSTGFVDHELKIKAPMAVIGLGTSFAHGFSSGLKSNPDVQRMLKKDTERKPTPTDRTAEKALVRERLESLKRNEKVPPQAVETLTRLMSEGKLTDKQVLAITDLPIDAWANRIAPLPKLDPAVHLSAAEHNAAIHPDAATAGGEPAVLSYDKVAPVVVKEKVSASKADYRRGYGLAESNGKATLIEFSENPGDMVFSLKTPFEGGDHIKPLASHGDSTYVYDSKARTVLKITTSQRGQLAQVIESARVRTVNASDLMPAIRKEPALVLGSGDRTVELASGARRATTIDSRDDAGIKLSKKATGSAAVLTDGNGFFVRNTSGNVSVHHSDGTVTSIKVNESLALRAGDRLNVGGEFIDTKSSTNKKYTLLPLRNMETANKPLKAAVDMTQVEKVEAIPQGFAYCENKGLPQDQKVRTRIVDPARDPVLLDFINEAKKRYSHLQGQELMQALTEYVNARMTPLVVDSGYGGKPKLRQGKGMENVAKELDSTGNPIMLGDLIARRSAVCLDQAVALKVLAQEMGVKAELTTGKYMGGGHAWVTMTDPKSGKPVIFDPRNYTQQTAAERAGLGPNREYNPYSKDNPRSKSNPRLMGTRPDGEPKIKGDKTPWDVRPLNPKSLRPDDPTLAKWMENGLERLNLDPDEQAAFSQALAEGKIRFAVLDRDTLAELDRYQKIWSFEGGKEVNNKPYKSGAEVKTPLQNADSYDPAVWPAATLMIRVPSPSGDNYYVQNGCRRIHVFGSEKLNPNNKAIPAFVFDSPETMLKVLGSDPASGIRRATPFNFEDAPAKK